MSTVATDIHHCFKPIQGQRPWRARLGVGSFLTFDFGPKVRLHGHDHGSWHLWIYMANWVLIHHDRQPVNADSDRRPISVAVRRLEAEPFTGVEIGPQNSSASFSFGDFQLIVTPCDDLDQPGERDEYWMFYMPQNLVLTAGLGGLALRPSDK